MFIERKAFSRDLDYDIKQNFLQKICYKIEPYLEIYALRHADGFIVENNRAKKIIMFYGAQSEKIKILPYYIQDYFLEGTNPEFNRGNDVFKIGYVGRFKKYDLLTPIIDAIGYLKEDHYKIKLFMIGDGPTKGYIEKLVEKKALSNEISFLGPRSHDKVSEIINDFHCLLFPMISNLCPSTIAIKVLEGVMKGKIVITTNSGNNSSLFMNYRDLILNDNTSKSITQKICLVIENYEHYRKIAEKLSNFHSNLRSKQIYSERLENMLLNIK
jgi:glycosyltransferase involved in cell wall biosynthesis